MWYTQKQKPYADRKKNLTQVKNSLPYGYKRARNLPKQKEGDTMDDFSNMVVEQGIPDAMENLKQMALEI